jgi:hypothetical protein
LRAEAIEGESATSQENVLANARLGHRLPVIGRRAALDARSAIEPHAYDEAATVARVADEVMIVS